MSGPSDDRLGHDELRAVVRDFAARPADATTWKRLSAELGLTALPLDAGPAEIAVVVEELGRALLPVPYLSSAVVTSLIDPGSAAARFLPGLADGSLVGALALDPDHVLDGAVADVLLVPDGDELRAVPATDADVVARPTLDQTRTQARVRASGGLATGSGTAAASELMRTLLAVECAGAAAHCLDATVAYLKQRHQFGRPLGSFQALKHRCADLAVEVESARATAAAAVAAADRSVLAPLAKRHCADVFVHVAEETIQLHGGIAITWEHEAHRYLKRAKTTQLLHGTPSTLRAEVARRARLWPS